MDINDAFYFLTIEDLQTVALEELERELTKEEIQVLIDAVPDNIPWYDIIANTMAEKGIE